MCKQEEKIGEDQKPRPEKPVTMEKIKELCHYYYLIGGADVIAKTFGNASYSFSNRFYEQKETIRKELEIFEEL